MSVNDNRAVTFFERQFQDQVRQADYALNPFEQAVLPHLSGHVLDLGCGLGNLALAAARRGCRVHALDLSPTAVADLARRAAQENLAIHVEQADLRHWRGEGCYDCVVSIGLLMFFAPREAHAQLDHLKTLVRPGGIAAVNVLIEGTTFMEMFDPNAHTLFAKDELDNAFLGWACLYAATQDFAAAGSTIKRFRTLIARRPE